MDGKKVVNENDRRVKRTKRCLRDALLKLLKEKPYNKISVTELTSMADINRATFYFYYDDIPDMLNHIQDEAIEIIEEKIKESKHFDGKTRESFYELVERTIIFCKENSDLFKFIVNNDTNNKVYKRVVQLIFDALPKSNEIFPASDVRHYFATYISYAVMGVIVQWYDDGMNISVSELSHFIADTYFDGAISIINKLK